MEFPNSLLSNVHVVEGFSNIEYRIYVGGDVGVEGTVPTSPDTKNDQIRSLGQIRDAEFKLRKAGCLAAVQPTKQELWLFAKDGDPQGFVSRMGDLSNVGDVETLLDNLGLRCVFPPNPPLWDNANGSTKVHSSSLVAASDLVKGLSLPNRQIPSSAKTMVDLKMPSPVAAVSHLSNVFRMLMAAVVAFISLRMASYHQVLPLNSRTFFTSCARSVANNDEVDTGLSWERDSDGQLIVLQIVLAATGTLTISSSTMRQPGIYQISALLHGNKVDVIERNISDLWLAPGGRVARYIGTEQELTSTETEEHGEVENKELKDGLRREEEKRKAWKLRVRQYIENREILLTKFESESWVEVEILGLTSLSRSSLPSMSPFDPESIQLRRILWPASLCFTRRASPVYAQDDADTNSVVSDFDDPLHFAEDWLANAESRQQRIKKKHSSLLADEAQQEEVRSSEHSSRNYEVPNNVENLARTTNYLELQAASAVYPTPPDGTLSQIAPGAASTDGLDVTPANAGDSIPPFQDQNELDSIDGDIEADFPGDKDMLMSGVEGPSTDFGIRTGLYDASGDEELFGDMDAENFDSKGMVDPDFSFFDEPSLDEMDGQNEDLFSGLRDSGRAQTMETIVAGQNGQQLQSDSEAVGQDADRRSLPIAVETSSAQVIAVDDGPNDDENTRPTSELQSAPSGQSQTDDSKMQTRSPPLSPLEIKKKLGMLEYPSLAPLYSSKIEPTPNRESNMERFGQNRFDPISFQETLTRSDRKYSSSGRFWFESDGKDTNEKVTKSKDVSAKVSIIELPATIENVNIDREPKNEFLRSVLQTPYARIEEPGHDQEPPSSSRSGVSDQSSSDVISEMSAMFTSKLGTKRKRSISDDDASISSSVERQAISTQFETDGTQEDMTLLLEQLSSDVADWPLAGYFSTGVNRATCKLPVSNDNFMKVAQILVDQVTQSTLFHQLDGGHIRPTEEVCSTQDDAIEEVGLAFRDCAQLDLQSYVSMDDRADIEGPRASIKQENVDAPSMPASTHGAVFGLSTPHVRVKRAKSSMEVLPSVLPFWETFSLEPASGSKDIASYCIHPASLNTREGAEAFLKRLGDVYQSCNLGSYVRGDAFDKGMLPWMINSVGDTNDDPAMNSLKDSCERLGSALCKSPLRNHNFIISIINPYTNGSAFADICAAFLTLVQKYNEDTEGQQSQSLNELILQIVPLSFVASSEAIVVPTQAEYLRLALEVYNRCPRKDAKDYFTAYGPASILSEHPPTSINFSLASDALSSLLSEGKCLHVAYSMSMDQRWVTAAWTDNSGSFQMSMSYCLRKKDSSGARNMSEILKEIWETTWEIMRKTKVTWRLMIVKEGTMEVGEINAWAILANLSAQTQSISVSLTTLTVNVNPALSLRPSSSQMQSAFNPQTVTYTTPVSTPQPNMVSPDQFGNAATPASGNAQPNAPTPNENVFELDGETILVDASDECWGIVLAHRLNNSNSLVEYRPALASGYLVKRKGTTDSDGIVAMSVNIISAQTGYEELMKEILGMYRGLVTSARAKGIIHPVGSVLPWHIATVVKGQQTLSYVL